MSCLNGFNAPKAHLSLVTTIRETVVIHKNKQGFAVQNKNEQRRPMWSTERNCGLKLLKLTFLSKLDVKCKKHGNASLLCAHAVNIPQQRYLRFCQNLS